jgi:hypothetical protein
MKENNVDIESVKTLIDRLANEAYENGWDDCKENYSHQQFSPARTDMLTQTVKVLQKENKDFKKRLTLATKLLRYAQKTPCGSQGQFDRFFEEGYNYDNLEFELWCDEVDKYYVANDKTGA